MWQCLTLPEIARSLPAELTEVMQPGGTIWEYDRKHSLVASVKRISTRIDTSSRVKRKYRW